MTELYQFAISHYCEKARWALDHKNISYKTRNLLPGPHISQVKKIARKSEVPVLKINGEVIQGSGNIIDYLDKHYADASLTPENETEKQEAAEWETLADKQLGIPIRLFIYSTIINDSSKIIPLWTRYGPWYGNLFYKLFFSKVRRAVKKGMNVNPESAKAAKGDIKNAIQTLNNELSEKRYLVGNKLSRADISVCSMLAPFVLPEKSYMQNYLPYPDEALAFREQFVDNRLFEWVDSIYSNHR